MGESELLGKFTHCEPWRIADEVSGLRWDGNYGIHEYEVGAV